jgi:hypothetical protein
LGLVAPKGTAPCRLHGAHLRNLEPLAGIEPALSSLPRRCFTTKLQRRSARVCYSVRREQPYKIWRRQLRNRVIKRPPHFASLTINRRRESQEATVRKLSNRNTVHRIHLFAIHRENISFVNIATITTATMIMVAYAIEAHDTVSNPPGLHYERERNCHSSRRRNHIAHFRRVASRPDNHVREKRPLPSALKGRRRAWCHVSSNKHERLLAHQAGTLERAARIELALSAWKAEALPLCNARENGGPGWI